MGGFFLLGAVVVARLLVSQPSSSALIPIPATYGFIASDEQPRALYLSQSSFSSADGPLRKAPLLNGGVFQSVSERGNDDSGNGANPAGILVHESEEPVNEVITDDIFAGILLICGAYAWFKWCNGKSGENENDDDGP